MLKKIGTEARKELEELFGTKVYLQTFVKVVPDWRESPQKVRELDWHFQLEGLSENQREEVPPPIDTAQIDDGEYEPEADDEREPEK